MDQGKEQSQIPQRKRQRKDFSVEERTILLSYYNRGMIGYGLPEQNELIQAACQETGLEKHRVKKWIDNYKASKKERVKSTFKQRPTRLLDVFRSQYLSEKFKTDPTIDSKNILKECGAKWREVKGDAVKLAALAADSAEAQSQERPESTAADRRNIMRMFHKRIKRLCLDIEEYPFLDIGILMSKKDTTELTVFGSGRGREFLDKREDIQWGFLSYSTGQIENASHKDPANLLRSQVQDLLNAKYSECIGKSRPFSYKAFEEGKIKVLGLPFPLKRPAAYGSAALRQILDAADTISVIATPPGKTSRSCTLTKEKQLENMVLPEAVSEGQDHDQVVEMRSEEQGVVSFTPLELPSSEIQQEQPLGENRIPITAEGLKQNAAKGGKNRNNRKKRKEEPANLCPAVQEENLQSLNASQILSSLSNGGNCLEEENLFDVEKILNTKTLKGDNYYLIKWKGFSSNHNTWEPEINIPQHFLTEFWKKQIKRI